MTRIPMISHIQMEESSTSVPMNPTVADLEEAIDGITFPMTEISKSMLSLYKEDSENDGDNWVSELNHLRDETATEALEYLEEVLPSCTSMIKGLHEIFESISISNFKDWKQHMSFFLEKWNKCNTFGERVRECHEDILGKMALKRKAFKILEEKLKIVHENAADPPPKRTYRQWFTKSTEQEDSEDMSISRAKLDKKKDKLHLVNSTLIPAIENFFCCILQMTDFIKVYNKKLQQLATDTYNSDGNKTNNVDQNSFNDSNAHEEMIIGSPQLRERGFAATVTERVDGNQPSDDTMVGGNMEKPPLQTYGVDGSDTSRARSDASGTCATGEVRCAEESGLPSQQPDGTQSDMPKQNLEEIFDGLVSRAGGIIRKCEKYYMVVPDVKSDLLAIKHIKPEPESKSQSMKVKKLSRDTID